MLDAKVAELLNTQINKEFLFRLFISGFCKLLYRRGTGRLCQLVQYSGSGGARPCDADSEIFTE